ncbi:EamA family transporter [Streptomyces tanashiensis]
MAARTILLAVVFGTMNLSLYTAIGPRQRPRARRDPRVPPGPLAIALAATRRRVDVLCALLATAGVVILMRPQPSTDYVGMGSGLLGAVCWASYILLNRTVGSRVPGAPGHRRRPRCCPP